MKSNFLKQFILGSFLVIISGLFNTTYAQLPKSYDFQPKGEPIYVVDEVVANKSYLDKLNPDQIEFMAVLKGEQATEKYGDKGINGVIEITTKKDNVVNDNIGISTAGKPIMIVDGVELDGNLNSISPDDIVKMEVFKGKEAINKYGSKGKNGIVVITTKKTASSNSNVEPSIPIYYVEGVEKTKLYVESINPIDIKSIDVFKGESAIEKYGDKAKNGVVEIF